MRKVRNYGCLSVSRKGKRVYFVPVCGDDITILSFNYDKQMMNEFEFKINKVSQYVLLKPSVHHIDAKSNKSSRRLCIPQNKT